VGGLLDGLDVSLCRATVPSTAAELSANGCEREARQIRQLPRW